MHAAQLRVRWGNENKQRGHCVDYGLRQGNRSKLGNNCSKTLPDSELRPVQPEIECSLRLNSGTSVQ